LPAHFDRPQSKPVALEVSLDALDHRIALCACQNTRKVLHYTSVSVQLREGTSISGHPSPQ
ncbi:MAG TPA: hypothetical protein VEV86_07200, partial [Vicinamibacterales bacterium]|nr:hypothetical protein [Vicinamibacterales bacterium]